MNAVTPGLGHKGARRMRRTESLLLTWLCQRLESIVGLDILVILSVTSAILKITHKYINHTFYVIMSSTYRSQQKYEELEPKYMITASFSRLFSKSLRYMVLSVS